MLARFASLTDHLVECDRIRVHGDLHLAQVLERGGDVTFIDFCYLARERMAHDAMF